MEEDSTSKPYSIYVMEDDEGWYIGSAFNKTTPRDRYTRHYNGTGGATKLWEKIQAGAVFTQTILETGLVTDREGTCAIEEAWIHEYLAADLRECLNINIYPSRATGWAESPESIARRAEKARGKPNKANHERLVGQPRPDLVDAWAKPGAKAERSAAVKAGIANMSDEDREAMIAKQRRPRRAVITHCGYGHEFTPENTYNAPCGTRQCRACNTIRSEVQCQGIPDPRVKVFTPRVKTHCSQDHEMTPDNSYINPSTGRAECRECKKEAAKRRQAKKTAR